MISHFAIHMADMLGLLLILANNKLPKTEYKIWWQNYTFVTKLTNFF